MRIILLIVFYLISSLKLFAQTIKMIEFGWDNPDVNQLNLNLPEMQNTPFHGICFSLQKKISEAFDPTEWAANYFQYQQLKQLKWGKYSENFLILRGYGIKGGQWDNDKAWMNIVKNLGNLSIALNTPGIKGVLFDPEYYYEDQFYNPWTYSKRQFPNYTYEQICVKVKARGAQFIQALQKYKSDLILLSIWITSLVIEDKKTARLEDTRHALLVPFFEGILEGKKLTTEIIDGNELGYWFTKPSQFLETHKNLKDSLVSLMKTSKAKTSAATIKIAQPLFYDGLLAKDKTFDKGYDNITKWKWLNENLKYAIASTDKYVWFYSERIDWWKGKISDTLVSILEEHVLAQSTNKPIIRKLLFGSNSSKNENLNRGTGYYYPNEKIPMSYTGPAFSYSLNRKSKILTFDVKSSSLFDLTIFLNNKLIRSIQNLSNSQKIYLPEFTPGKLIMLAKYKDQREAVAIEIYK